MPLFRLCSQCFLILILKQKLQPQYNGFSINVLAFISKCNETFIWFPFNWMTLFINWKGHSKTWKPRSKDKCKRAHDSPWSSPWFIAHLISRVYLPTTVLPGIPRYDHDNSKENLSCREFIFSRNWQGLNLCYASWMPLLFLQDPFASKSY